MVAVTWHSHVISTSCMVIEPYGEYCTDISKNKFSLYFNKAIIPDDWYRNKSESIQDKNDNGMKWSNIRSDEEKTKKERRINDKTQSSTELSTGKYT